MLNIMLRSPQPANFLRKQPVKLANLYDTSWRSIVMAAHWLTYLYARHDEPATSHHLIHV